MEKPVRQPRGEEVDFALIAANQRLSPEERLNAFLTHSRLMMELYLAGQAARALPPQRPRRVPSRVMRR